jgi:hypothetical protein
MRYLCPSSHSYAGITWDDRREGVAEARDRLGVFVVEATAEHGLEVPVCPVCGSTSFTALDGGPQYRSMQGAALGLLLEHISQHQAMVMSPDRN